MGSPSPRWLHSRQERNHRGDMLAGGWATLRRNSTIHFPQMLTMESTRPAKKWDNQESSDISDDSHTASQVSSSGAVISELVPKGYQCRFTKWTSLEIQNLFTEWNNYLYIRNLDSSIAVCSFHASSAEERVTRVIAIERAARLHDGLKEEIDVLVSFDILDGSIFPPSRRFITLSHRSRLQ